MAKTNRKAAAAVSTPTKDNAQQEKFLQLVAEGSVTQARAYEIAYGTGGKTAEVNACQLLRNPRFKARLAEIQADNAIAAQVSVASVTRMYRRIYENSMAAGEHGPAVLATTGIAKLHGLVIDKVAAEILVRKPRASPDSPTEMSAEAWMESFGKAPLIETDFQRVAAPVAEPQAPAAEPRPAEPRAGASNANSNVWKPEAEPDPFAAASNEVRRRASSGSAKPGVVVDMNDDADGGFDRVMSAPRRPAPAPDVAAIETLDGGAGEGSDMFVVAKPEPTPRDLIAEQFEISARD